MNSGTLVPSDGQAGIGGSDAEVTFFQGLYARASTGVPVRSGFSDVWPLNGHCPTVFCRDLARGGRSAPHTECPGVAAVPRPSRRRPTGKLDHAVIHLHPPSFGVEHDRVDQVLARLLVALHNADDPLTGLVREDDGLEVDADRLSANHSPRVEACEVLLVDGELRVIDDSTKWSAALTLPTAPAPVRGASR